MKGNYLKGTASFMIALILSLPIYSSFVFAILNNGYVYGETDSVRGYYKRHETIYFNITAWISGDDEITPSQLHLDDSRGPTFNSCTDRRDGSFYCSYQADSYPITQNPYQRRVVLYDDSENFNSMFIVHGAFDEYAPEIKSFSITPEVVGSGNINFNYDIYDHSYSETDTNRCTGIKKIELSHNGEIVKTEELNSPADQCGTSGSIVIPVSELNASEGVIEIVLTAYDNFNQGSSAAAQFVYDPNPPSIDTSSLEVIDDNEDSIDYIGDDIVNGVIRFIVESDDLDVNNVYGDISEINVNAPLSYNNKQAACAQIEEGYKCSFTNIEFKLTESINAHLAIKIQDLAGNMESAVLTKSITHDTTGPSVTGIKTDKVDDDISYAGASANFIVELNEAGIGIDKSSIKLDLSSIKTGLKNKAADECSHSGSEWACYWYGISPDKNDGEKTISVSGSDKLGNEITGTLSATVILDKTKPVVTSSDVTAVGVSVEAFEGHIKTGDTLDVTLNIKEKNKPRAYADFSSFVTTEDIVAGSCTQEDEEDWKCEWSSSPIDVPGHILSDINFNITDLPGNSIEYQEAIEVFDYEDAVDVSYWTSSVTCSPNLVDRQITDLVSTRVYCSIVLQPVTPDQETLSINLGYCTDRFNNSLGYIENIRLLNAETGSTEPYFAIDLIKGDMTIDQLSITCPLQIISRVGTKINQNPEIEPINIDINFYNMPLGEYGDGIESRIKDAKDDAFGGLWKTLGFLKKIVSYARLICNVLYTFHKIWLVSQVFTEGVTTAHIAMIGTPVEPVLGASAAAACRNDATMEELTKRSYTTGFGNKWCKIINCQTSPKAPGSDKGGGGEGDFKEIATSIKEGHWFDQYADWPISLPTGGKGNRWVSGTISEVTGKQYYQYANSRDNFFVALVTGCIPGMINGLEKLRQIKCLYADCLEQNAYNNVPPKICEDQQQYATCKYWRGEILALIPYTALFDYYMGMIRGAFSDPITAIATGANILFKVCEPICDPSGKASIQWKKNQLVCRGVQFATLLGGIINDVEGIIDSYDQIKNDYCERLDDDD